MSNFNNNYTFITLSQWSNSFSFKWSQTSAISKITFSLSIWIIVLQVTSIPLVLYSTYDLSCREPFRLFLAIHAIRCLISTPFSVYLHFGYTQPSEYDDEDDINLIRLERTRKALKQIQLFVNVFSIVWFLFGNYLVYFSSDAIIECDLTAPLLYNLSYIIVLCGYLLVLLPILFTVIRSILLPCLISLLQNLQIINVDGDADNQGLSPMDISLLPLYHFRSSPTTNTGASSTTTKPDSLFTSNKQDQFCVICLSKYQNNQLICKLWCQHHFHKKCIVEWLKVNARCPLCKRDCRNFSDTEKKQVLPM